MIKSFNTENSVKENYAKETEEYEKRALHLTQIQAAFGPLMVIIVGISKSPAIYFSPPK